jgi:hypothetical protein
MKTPANLNLIVEKLSNGSYVVFWNENSCGKIAAEADLPRILHSIMSDWLDDRLSEKCT